MIPISYPSPRVSQLDAHILDSELISLLKEQLTGVFHLHNSKWWTFHQHPELYTLMLNLLVFKLTVWKTGSSYGLALQNLKLTAKNGNKIGIPVRGLLLATIIGKYLFDKLQSYLYSLEDESQASQSAFKKLIMKHKTVLLTKVSNAVKLLSLANFTLFLVNGKYPSLTHRVLGISLTPIVTDLLKFNGDKVNFEFQNRQLVWNVMTEFLVFILPLLQLKKLRRLAHNMLEPYRKRVGKKGSEKNSSIYSTLPVSQCAICHRNNELSDRKSANSVFFVTNPYVTNCGHVFCYICLATRFNALESGDEDFESCPRCSTKLTWFEEYGHGENDVDPDAIMVDYEDASDEEIPEKEEQQSDEDGEDSDEEEGSDGIPEPDLLDEQDLDVDASEVDSDYSEGEDDLEDEAFE